MTVSGIFKELLGDSRDRVKLLCRICKTFVQGDSVLLENFSVIASVPLVYLDASRMVNVADE